MHDRRWLFLIILLLGVCGTTAGCTQGFGAYRRDPVAVGEPPAPPGECVIQSGDPVRPPGQTAYADRGAVVRVSNEVSEPADLAAPEVRSNPRPPAPGAIVEPSPSSDSPPAAVPKPPQPSDSQPAAGLKPAADAPPGQPEVVPLPLPGPVQKPPPAAAKPATPAAAPPAVNVHGDKLDVLHVDNIDVRKVLELLGRSANVNIVVSPGVGGRVTLNLRDKSLDEILAVIQRACHLSIRREKDVIWVSTPAEVRQSEEEELPVRVYRLNYIKSGDVDTMIRSLLSPRGTLSASPESEIGIGAEPNKAGGNSMAGGEIVIIQDYEERLRVIDRVIAEVDVQPVQVLIEAVIVQVTLTKEMDLGINYAVLDGAGKALGVAGNGAAINAAAGFTPASVLTTAGALAPGFADGTNGIKFGWVGGSTSGFISALETYGRTKVLASPRVLVLNKQSAQIQLGDRLGYQTASQTQTSTVQQVQFVEVGTLLRLRPYVSSDGMIRLEIHPERSSGELNAAGVPQTHNAQVTSNVMIPDGATMVIGGLIDNEVDKNWEGLPFLSRIPLIGYLFRQTTDTTTKKELVIILTPHIYRPQCPEATNYLGRPRTLGLDKHLEQLPHAEMKDGPSCFELMHPDACPQGVPPAADLEPVPQR